MSHKKSLIDRENEATWVGFCLVHPASVKSNISRKVYQLRHGKLRSSKIFVCHTCDNGQCILDAHHFLGGQIANMQDAKKKGRLKRSEDTKIKLSRALIGRPKSAAAKKNMARAALGRKASLQARKNMSLAQKGRVMRPESRTKLSKAIMGHVVSTATRVKISLAQKGRPRAKKIIT